MRRPTRNPRIAARAEIGSNIRSPTTPPSPSAPVAHAAAAYRVPRRSGPRPAGNSGSRQPLGRGARSLQPSRRPVLALRAVLTVFCQTARARQPVLELAETDIPQAFVYS